MSLPEETLPTDAARPARAQRLLSRVGWLFAAILVLAVISAAAAGFQAGARQREDQFRATQTAELQHQYELGLSDLADGRYEVAAARFDYVLGLDPRFPGAAEQLAKARAAVNVTAAPRPTAIPTLPPSQQDDPSALLARAERLAEAGDWTGVISQLTLLRTVDADYEAIRVDQLLFRALRNRGLARIQGDKMEAGIFDLDQAAAYSPLDQEAVNFRAWARLHLAANSFWGLDWGRTVGILRELHLIAPNFKNTTRRLYDATLQFAAELEAAGDYCSAADAYAASQDLFNDPDVADKQRAAIDACLLGPTATPEGEPPADPTPTP